MENFDVYRDIQARTGGEIYVGVVGPVRTGKSTFIKRFMELLVLPGMEDESARERARDEMPQSSAGKTIMTTEPKFIPREAAQVALSEETEVKIRLIDCVGFMVEGAAGHTENEAERLVKTPWSEEAIPFTEAAEIGTRKVINDHSTIGLMVTADGSFGEIPRENYRPAEEKTVNELKRLSKPFLILLNSMRPLSEETRLLARSMEESYGAKVMPVNCEQLKEEEIRAVLEEILLEFPVKELDFSIPQWLEILPPTHPFKEEVIRTARFIFSRTLRMRDAETPVLPGETACIGLESVRLHLDDGTAEVKVTADEERYYQVLSEYAGIPIRGQYELMNTLRELAAMRKEYEQAAEALLDVRNGGYGVLTPSRDEIRLDEPKLTRHGNQYGVRMRAQAPSVNLIRAQIETEIAPIVGSEQQALDLIRYLKENAGEDGEGIWNAQIFGKSIEEIVDDGIRAKISQMTEECRLKLQDALQKILNDSNGGMVCIII